MLVRRSIAWFVAICLVCALAGTPAMAAAADSPDASPTAARDAGVVATGKSPDARLHAVPIHAVKMKDGFWLPRMEANRQKGIPRLLQLLEDHGVVDNFRRVSGHKKCDRRGPYFTDSDLYKWMEACAFVLQSTDDPAIREGLDKVIDEVVAIQGPDGYLNTYFVDERKDKRFSKLSAEHELYCAGHLFQAAVADYRATGQRKLLDAALKYADYLTQVFGPGKIEQADGHPEVEMALVELYRTTGKQAYLDLSRFFLDIYKFPTRKVIEGHAVRAAYLNCGGVDYYMESGRRPYLDASARMWQDMVGGKIYITGGIGATSHGEAFGASFDLPNASSYAETCAGIASAMWNWRMLAATGEARFSDEMERVLYNGFLSGVSLGGDEYFYVNPLESAGGHKRVPWYDCTCCPPNVERTLAAMPGYMYSTGPAGIWVHLYDNNELNWRLEDGRKIRLTQETRYPWDDQVTLTVSPESAGQFSVFLRIPAWCTDPKVSVNGRPADATARPGTYCEIKRTWQPGDKIALNLPMPVVVQVCDPRVRNDRGRVALQRGPVVYCLESVDNPGVEILSAMLPVDTRSGDAGAQVAFKPDLLGGVCQLTLDGIWPDYSATAGPLYRPAKPSGMPAVRRARLTAIPYYAWANRGDSQMIVWVPFVAKD
jgi:DUF1680 family protein